MHTFKLLIVIVSSADKISCCSWLMVMICHIPGYTHGRERMNKSGDSWLEGEKL